MTAPYAFLSETHTAVVVGLGDRVFKVKKPVDLGFLDQRSLPQRHAACEREVELNRRFSPDVYLGVGSLRTPDEEEPEPAVVMRRLPEDRRLATLARTGTDLDDEVRRVAHVVAAYHAVAPGSPVAREAASLEVTRGRWDTNIEEMRPWVGSVLDQGVFDDVTSSAHRYLDGRGRLFAARIDHGWARDGHGDLLADDIFCLDDGPRILDCLDFDERLRMGDVLADAAFLAMDLERLGRPELGWAFLRAHAELLDDHWPSSLAHHHIAYRAQIRAKVSCIRADQGDEQAADRARLLLGMVDRHLAEATVRLVLVGGAPGTGKSTLSSAVGDRLGLVVLTADHVRKELAGLDARSGAAAELDQGIYDDEHTRATYAELTARARHLLEGGVSVLLDAGWRDPERREAARAVAAETTSALVELRCDAPEQVTLDRIRQRRDAGGDASDVDVEVARALRARTPPWPEARVIDTSQPVERSVDEAVGAIVDAR